MATPRRASLHQAVLKRDLSAINEELDVPWERIKRRRVNVEKDGFSALHIALSETMGAVLEGASNGKPNIEALSETHFPILKRLVEAGADVNLNFPCASTDKANTAFGVFCKTMVVALDAFAQAEKATKKKEADASRSSSSAGSSSSDSSSGSSSEAETQKSTDGKKNEEDEDQSEASKAFHKILGTLFMFLFTTENSSRNFHFTTDSQEYVAHFRSNYFLIINFSSKMRNRHFFRARSGH